MLNLLSLYGDSYRHILAAYHDNPEKTVPILIMRLKNKISEWVSLAGNYKAEWRVQLQEATKSLARHTFMSNKQMDMKQFHPRYLLGQLFEQQKSGPVVLNFQNVTAVEDILNLICRYLRRQPIAQNEKSALKFLIYHHVPEMLNIHNGSMSDDDYENLGEDEHLKSVIAGYVQPNDKTKRQASFSGSKPRKAKNNGMVLFIFSC